jgi:hypothetical protein
MAALPVEAIVPKAALPWRCESAARAGGRAEAVVPRPGRARLDWAIATARSTVLAAVDGAGDAYARPGRRRSAAHFRFRLGRRPAVVARDRADKASSCRGRTIEAPAAQPGLAGRAGLPLRWGAPAHRRSGRSPAPRPARQRCRPSRVLMQRFWLRVWGLRQQDVRATTVVMCHETCVMRGVVVPTTRVDQCRALPPCIESSKSLGDSSPPSDWC